MPPDLPIPKVMFSVHHYDHEGTVIEKGIFLHFGHCRVLVALTPEEFQQLVDRLNRMSAEIADNYKEVTK